MRLKPAATIFALTVATGLSQLPYISQAQADHENRRYKSERSSDPADSNYRRRRGLRSSNAAERAQADHYDPSCSLCGYPDWARIALSHKKPGGR